VSTAGELLEALVSRGETVATAESLTGGLLAAAFTDVPGSSRAFRGGVVSYATDLKASLLGVPEDVLGALGPVDESVAVLMARGVRERCAATYGLATTGVAGPDPQDGKSPGTVHLALATSGPGVTARTLALPGDRAAVRAATVAAALDLLGEVIGGSLSALG
jgi:nicotinamide-nucleotide amidase